MEVESGDSMCNLINFYLLDMEGGKQFSISLGKNLQPMGYIPPSSLIKRTLVGAIRISSKSSTYSSGQGYLRIN